jgi:hypothetical protein
MASDETFFSQARGIGSNSLAVRFQRNLVDAPLPKSLYQGAAAPDRKTCRGEAGYRASNLASASARKADLHQ